MALVVDVVVAEGSHEARDEHVGPAFDRAVSRQSALDAAGRADVGTNVAP